jgi:hypothetical protein
VGEATAGIFGWPAGALHDAIESDKGQDNDFSHGAYFTGATECAK